MTGLRLIYADHPEELDDADLIILPGTRSTMHDLLWMKKRGLGNAVIRAEKKGLPIIGICGGYQMLGKTIQDQDHHYNSKGYRDCSAR